ncbi:MAG: aldo/keto reductase [Micrococcales bacterium]|nr:aldo/keto reductase [Micrococcales bacterium]
MTASPVLRLADGHGIPQLGLGTYKTAPEAAAALVEGALRLGYRHIDTAALYRNEREVGEGIRSSGVPRDEVYVTTKLGNDDHGYDAALRALEASLERLGTERVELYLIHWPVPSRDLYVDAWRALIRARDDGLARSIGVSNFHPHHLQRLLDATGEAPAVNQVELHPRLPQWELQEWDAAHGIATESWAPLARGRLLDEPALAEVARRHGRTPAQIVIRWHLDRGLILFPKTSSLERVAENFDVFGFTLDDADRAAIDALRTDERTGRNPDDD